jgi:hypothetical protein
MLWITKNNNIFASLLIFIISFIKISPYNDEFPFYNQKQKEEINEMCEQNKIICPMASAIEEIFSSIQKEEIPVKDEMFCDILCILYTNVYARDIIFDEHIQINPSNNSITLNNCIILIEGKISYKNSDITSVDFGTFLSELKIESITFYKKRNKDGEIMANFTGGTKRYNYNKNNAIFSSEILNMTEQMDYIMENIYEKYLNKINEKIIINSEMGQILTNTLKKLENTYSFYEGPGIYDEKKNITYISYIKSNYEKYVHLNGIIFFSSIKVNFEYALNNNITYNEGYFVIDNIIFEEKESVENRYEKCTIFDKSNSFDNLKNKEDIWNTIFEDFKKVLYQYKGNENDNNEKNLFL